MNLRAVWSAPTTDARLKKRIVRTVIHEVVADIDDEASEIVLLIHWIGGVHTELRLPKRRRGQRNSTTPEIIAAVRQLVLIATDDLIAGILNRNGLLTGHGNRWTRERVTALRSHHKIPVFRPRSGRHRTMAQSEQGRAPARRCDRRPSGSPPKPARSRASIHYRTVRGSSAAQHLDDPAAQQHRSPRRQNPKYPTGSHPDQQNLFTSTA